MDYGNVQSGAEILMWTWHEGKHFLERSVAFSQDAVHVIVGVLLMLTAAVLLRKPLSSWWPLLVVLVTTFINEFIDLWVEQWPDPAIQYGEGFKDLLLTMLLPTVLLVTTRFWPRLYQPPRRRASQAKAARRSKEPARR